MHQYPEEYLGVLLEVLLSMTIQFDLCGLKERTSAEQSRSFPAQDRKSIILSASDTLSEIWTLLHALFIIKTHKMFPKCPKTRVLDLYFQVFLKKT